MYTRSCPYCCSEISAYARRCPRCTSAVEPTMYVKSSLSEELIVVAAILAFALFGWWAVLNLIS